MPVLPLRLPATAPSICDTTMYFTLHPGLRRIPSMRFIDRRFLIHRHERVQSALCCNIHHRITGWKLYLCSMQARIFTLLFSVNGLCRCGTSLQLHFGNIGTCRAAALMNLFSGVMSCSSIVRNPLTRNIRIYENASFGLSGEGSCLRRATRY